MQRNLTSCPHRSGMMSWRRPLLGPHSLSVNPCETRATAGGLKNHRRSPPSAATIGAAARRLGKVWQLKSIQGSVKHRPCRSPPPGSHTLNGEVETAMAVKGKRICLGCKLAKTLALTLGGVWENGEKTSSIGDDADATPRFSPQEQPSVPNEGFEGENFAVLLNTRILTNWTKIHSVKTDVHFLSDSKTNVSLRKKTSPVMMPPTPWKGSFITSPAPSDRLQFWWHMCDSPSSFNQHTHTHTHTHTPLCLQIPCCQEGRLAGVCVCLWCESR